MRKHPGLEHRSKVIRLQAEVEGTKGVDADSTSHADTLDIDSIAGNGCLAGTSVPL